MSERFDMYNPSQSRDYHGRFGHGGSAKTPPTKVGGSTAGSAAGAGTSGATKRASPGAEQKSKIRELQKAAGVKARSSAGLRIAEHVTNGNHERAAKLVEGIKASAVAEKARVKAEKDQIRSLQKAAGVKARSAAGQRIAEHVKNGEHDTAKELSASLKVSATAEKARVKAEKTAAAAAQKAAHKEAVANVLVGTNIKPTSKAGREIAAHVKNGNAAEARRLADIHSKVIAPAPVAVKTPKAKQEAALVVAPKTTQEAIAQYKVDKAAFETKLNTDEHKAILAYSGADFGTINRALRTPSPANTKEKVGGDSMPVMTAVKHMDNGLDKGRTTEPMTTYRGLMDNSGRYKNVKVGDVVVDKGYVSTSALKPELINFHGDVELHITSPTGTRLAAIPTKNPSEKEYLLGRGAQLKVTHVEHGVPVSAELVARGVTTKSVIHATVVGTDPP